MKKIFKFLCIVISIFMSICLTSCKKKDDVNKSFVEVINNLSSYKLVGKLESNFPSGTKECVVTTYYKSPNMYRVELLNPNSVESQIMVKNNTGVYVLIPSVNKTFKVNSAWPANSSYPYLLQSIANDVVSDENMVLTKEGNDTILELKAKLFNKDGVTQKVVLDSNMMPKQVFLYNNNHDLISTFTVNSIEKNAKLDDNLFNTSETLETLNVYYKENPLEYDRTVNYPTYYPEGTSLKEESITGSGDNKFAVMTFSGAVNYTITQKYINDNEDLITEYVNGDIYVSGGTFIFANINNITFYSDGIQYTIASNDIETLEMIKMGDSLNSNDIK